MVRVQTVLLGAGIFHGSVLREHLYYITNGVAAVARDIVGRAAPMAGLVTSVVVGKAVGRRGRGAGH